MLFLLRSSQGGDINHRRSGESRFPGKIQSRSGNRKLGSAIRSELKIRALDRRNRRHPVIVKIASSPESMAPSVFSTQFSTDPANLVAVSALAAILAAVIASEAMASASIALAAIAAASMAPAAKVAASIAALAISEAPMALAAIAAASMAPATKASA